MSSKTLSEFLLLSFNIFPLKCPCTSPSPTNPLPPLCPPATGTGIRPHSPDNTLTLTYFPFSKRTARRLYGDDTRRRTSEIDTERERERVRWRGGSTNNLPVAAAI
ncbi:hypothetical protein HanRHA438_Chr11g0490521 [Helianthus annuus]|nr:hypothetical protein HanRHA438_Chr11g0490521 [Helianthus annuus]